MSLPPELLQAVVKLPALVRPIVLIDGGAGAGKTTLAEQLASQWPGVGEAQLVSLDELYPGWSGLAAGAAAVPLLITEHRYQRWDWRQGGPGEGRQVDPDRALIVEGCGAITPRSRELAGLAVWLELDEESRRLRALARDGAFASRWEEWAAQEAAHWSAHQPRALADLVLHG